MSRISTSGRVRDFRARRARSNGSPCVRSDRRSVRRMSNVEPLDAGFVRRVRSTGTVTASRRIMAETRARSSSVRSGNDFSRSTSTPLATIRIEVSSSSSGSSSPAERHCAATSPSVTSRSSGCSPQSTCRSAPGVGRFSSTRSSPCVISPAYQSANASS